MSAKQSAELKGLQSRLVTAQANLETVRAEHEAIVERLQSASKAVADLNAQIARLQEEAKDPIVSEHAILRWLERVRGVNVSEVIGEMLTERNKAAINFVRSGKVPAGPGVQLVVKDRVVVSVYTQDKVVSETQPREVI